MRGITTRVKDLFRYIFLVADYEPFEFLAAIAMFTSAMVLLNPYTDLYTNGASYKLVSAIVSESFLGTILLFAALNKFFALMCGDLHYRMWVTSIAAFIWGFLFVVFLSGNLSVWFPWMLGLFCLVSAATAARMRKDIITKTPPWTRK